MPARILIADDNPTMRHQLRRFLESNQEWQVCGEAVDGREAVEKTQLLKPDLVLLDLAMPEMDGLTAARQISQVLPEVPLIMYTLHCSPQLELEASKAGIRSVVAKQDGIHGLSSAIRSALRQKQPAQQLSPTPAIRNTVTPMTSATDPGTSSASSTEPGRKEPSSPEAGLPLNSDKPPETS